MQALLRSAASQKVRNDSETEMNRMVKGKVEEPMKI